MKTRMFVLQIVVLALIATLFGVGCGRREETPQPPVPAGVTSTATPTRGRDQPPPQPQSATPTPTAKPRLPDSIVAVVPITSTMTANSLEVRVTYEYVTKEIANAKIVVAALSGNNEPKGFKRGQAQAQPGRNTATLRVEYTGSEIVRTDVIGAFLAGSEDKPFAWKTLEQNKMWATKSEQMDDLAFEVQSKTENTIEAKVKYRYNTRHSNPALLKVEYVQNKSQEIHGMISRFEPPSVAQGSSGEAKLTITYEGLNKVESNQIAISLVDRVTHKPFQIEEFPLSKNWAPPPRDAISVEEVKEIHSGEIEVTVKYIYATDHSNRVEMMFGAYQGDKLVQPQANFTGNPYPPSPVTRGAEGKTTFRIRYDGTEKVDSDHIKLYLREYEKPPFFERIFRFEKKWIQGPRTVTGKMVQEYCGGDYCLRMQDDKGTKWDVFVQSLDQLHGAGPGTQVTYTGLVDSKKRNSIYDAVKGDQWAKVVTGDVISQKCPTAKLRDGSGTFWEVTFRDLADCSKFVRYDVVQAQGTPTLVGKGLKDATLTTSVSHITRLESLGNRSLTDETGLDLAAQISRTLLQNILDRYFTIHADLLTQGTLKFNKPQLNFYASRDDRIRVIISVTSPVSFDVDLEAQLQMTPEGDLLIKFSALDEMSVLLGDQTADTAASPRKQAWDTLRDHLRTNIKDIRMPLSFVSKVIGKRALQYNVTTHALIPDTASSAGSASVALEPKEWRLKVVPTFANGDGWLFVGATVLVGPDDKRGYGWWSNTYNMVSNVNGAVVISNRLMDALLQTFKPRPLPKAFALPQVIRPQHGLLVDVNPKLLILDQLDLAYEPGQLIQFNTYGPGQIVIRSAKIDFHLIDCFGCFDEHCYGIAPFIFCPLDIPTVSNPSEPGDRAQTQGFRLGDVRAKLTIPDRNAPVLTLSQLETGPNAFIDERGDALLIELYELFEGWDGILKSIDSALAGLNIQLLSLSFPLTEQGTSPKQYGTLRLTYVDARPKETILPLDWSPDR